VIVATVSAHLCEAPLPKRMKKKSSYAYVVHGSHASRTRGEAASLRNVYPVEHGGADVVGPGRDGNGVVKPARRALE
jgi:hypothetical protein